jgi:hypothetical protein
MMRFQAGRLAVLFSPLLMITACGSSGVRHATGDLNDRLQAQLAPDIAAGQATLQPLPDGAQVTLPEATTFSGGGGKLDAKGEHALASVIEGLLDPSLMRVELADAATTPQHLQDTRIQTVTQQFVQSGLGPSLQPAGPPPAPPSVGTVPAALTITINVQCPPPQGGWGYGTGQADPSCN